MNKFLIDFLYKITSRSFWIWLVSTYFVWSRIDGANGNTKYLILSWVFISFLYYGGDIIKQAIANMVSKGELKIGVGTQVNIGGQNEK